MHPYSKPSVVSTTATFWFMINFWECQSATASSINWTEWSDLLLCRLFTCKEAYWNHVAIWLAIQLLWIFAMGKKRARSDTNASHCSNKNEISDLAFQAAEEFGWQSAHGKHMPFLWSSLCHILCSVRFLQYSLPLRGFYAPLSWRRVLLLRIWKWLLLSLFSFPASSIWLVPLLWCFLLPILWEVRNLFLLLLCWCNFIGSTKLLRLSVSAFPPLRRPLIKWRIRCLPFIAYF